MAMVQIKETVLPMVVNGLLELFLSIYYILWPDVC
jgi:hypothetical protein